MGFGVPGEGTFVREARAMVDLQIGLHIFMVVLIFGTLWRLLSFHAIASPNAKLQHLGSAMAFQY